MWQSNPDITFITTVVILIITIGVVVYRVIPTKSSPRQFNSPDLLNDDTTSISNDKDVYISMKEKKERDGTYIMYGKQHARRMVDVEGVFIIVFVMLMQIIYDVDKSDQ